MKISPPELVTPVYLKLAAGMPWPEDEAVFYLMSREGLFLCRNTPFYRSCVLAERGPGELASHRPFLKLSYPKLPRALVETVVGFFDIIGREQGGEAAVLLAWDRDRAEYQVIVPAQTSVVSVGWNGVVYPLEVHYEVPALPSNLMLVGDMHCHVDLPAYSSPTDQRDEEYRPGLHLVVGRISREPPEWHAEAIVDGVRFRLKAVDQLMEGYTCRRIGDVPAEWLDQVTLKTWSSWSRQDYQAQTAGSKELIPRGQPVKPKSFSQLEP